MVEGLFEDACALKKKKIEEKNEQEKKKKEEEDKAKDAGKAEDTQMKDWLLKIYICIYFEYV